jgi:RNA polymerase sigma factor (sigma-70 family)
VTSAAVAAAVADAHRREWGSVLAATVRATRDIDLAEECVQDAYASALTSWEEPGGIPRKPGAWLTTVARNRALDQFRRAATLTRSLPFLVLDDDEPHANDFPDDRLRLICTCCHPALAQDAQVALTLRLLCGLSTTEVARAFLVSEPTMGARMTRAKKKIAFARIPYRVPSIDELPQRLEAVLAVVHLLFTTGHTAAAGADLMRRDLVERARDLARMLHSLLPKDPDVAGLLALILLTDARRSARVDDHGELVRLADQDRALWDDSDLSEGLELVRFAADRRPSGRYALQAAIAAVHARASTYDQTDWATIVELYDQLLTVWPSPVVAVNRAVAVGMSAGPAAGLAALDQLAGERILSGYPYVAATRAHFLAELGRTSEAAAEFRLAHDLTDNEVERAFLAARAGEVELSAPANRES